MLGKTSALFLCFLLSTLLLPLCRSSEEVDDEHEFDYLRESGRGPEYWGKINPEWSACDHGEMQSPIDLLHKRVEVLPNMGRLRRKYKPTEAAVINRGHDIMLKWKEDPGYIVINGTNFNLKQCHWHSPSEHTFNGSRYQLELHMVHISVTGKIAAVGITYKYGRPDPFLAKLLPHIRVNEIAETEVGIINPKDIKIGSRKYFRYMGSLTIPPCTEGVIWTIVKKVRTVSREQVRALREAVDDGCEENARPVQPKEDRPVWFYTPTGILSS
ncbi:hypothetical protein AAC387_Pa01g1829 [Persea americana]|eukprot:TRINITY_DN45672_c0_g1_i2.p1 TRINITY_DN45672_c0_g1~~TRINITY_DN45672_c0_g1_i2.p1  ORF type:complete len:271 (+),score=52.43 TRINITY_DN45672_c0_g1_i2:71-883(+)